VSGNLLVCAGVPSLSLYQNKIIEAEEARLAAQTAQQVN